MPALRATPLLTALLLLLVAPARPAVAQGWAAVDVGSQHTCALDAGGRAFCWGINHYGELGGPTPEVCGHAHHQGEQPRCYASPSDIPIEVQGGMRFRSLSVGGYLSCGLDDAGRAWCWGRGVGTAAPECAPDTVCSFRPVRWAPELVFRSLRLGEDAVCGITMEGAGRCWRPVWGDEGRWTMTAVVPGERLAWVDHYGDWMSRDEQVICAATEDGRAFCQGTNELAQLGGGDTVPAAGSVQVASAARFVQVRPWATWTCGLGADGAAYCWGAAEGRPSWPRGAPSNPGYFACGTSAWCSAPRQVAPGLRFAALTFVYDRACGLTPAGELHCWGIDGTPSRLADDLRFTAIDGSETHACALTAGGAAWCWGNNVSGSLTRLVRAPDPPR
jgi:Regulator of chromosome condensation (RCC1) repeat